MFTFDRKKLRYSQCNATEGTFAANNQIIIIILITVYMSNKVEHEICWYTSRRPKNNSSSRLSKGIGNEPTEPFPPNTTRRPWINLISRRRPPPFVTIKSSFNVENPFYYTGCFLHSGPGPGTRPT